MHAVRLHAFGPAENLVHERVPDPEPSARQVRIAVEAAGVHLLDAVLRSGRQLGPLPLPELPTIPGREVAGTVEALGPEADEALLGERVVAHLGPAPGGYAELATVDADALHPIPEALTPAQAVAMIGTGRTVLGVLDEVALSPADTVLVLAAAGGMGTLLTQFARAHGARTVGAAGGTEKTALVRELAPTLAVDYTRAGWTDEVRTALGTDRPVTHLFDGTGGELADAASTLLAPGAVHHAYGSAATLSTPEANQADTTPTRRTDIELRPLPAQLMQTRQHEFAAHALRLAAEGTFAPLLAPFPLREAAAAHHAMETRGTTGKVVLLP